MADATQSGAPDELIELGLVEIRDERPVLTIAGQDAVWDY
jgi:hypothetical protein